MDPGKQVIKEEFPGGGAGGVGGAGGAGGADSGKEGRGQTNRIRRKGPALKATPGSRSSRSSRSPSGSPPCSPEVPTATATSPVVRSPTSSPRSPTPTAASHSPAPATAAVLGVNGYASRLLNGGSPGPDRNAGGASPPSQPLALSLSDRSSRDRDGGQGASAAGAAGAAAGAASLSPARSLAKMKRFLSTLVQFGSDISPDTGDRVRGLVFSLVANGLTVEEFQHSLQEVTNFPLRSFVLPFLRGQLPALQRELHGLAKAAGEQSALQYLRHHEHLLLDPASASTAGDALDIFHAESSKHASKRAAQDSLDEIEEAENLSAWPKRAHSAHSAHAVPERAVVRGGGGGGGAGAVLHPRARHIPPPPHLQAHLHPQHPVQHAKEAEERRNNEDEWKNINVMLNCVLSMVEKTKHALVILQQRSTSSAESSAGQENGVALGVASITAGMSTAVSRQIKAAVDEIMARTLQDTEERIAELKRRAEETVNEVRRQAVLEIQRAVAAAEAQAADLMAAERASLERRLAGLSHSALQGLPGQSGQPGRLEAPQPHASHNGHSPPAERLAHPANSCWNCGRKAHETCSGCNVARYCGSFCQHKDWETHHQVCALRGAAAVASAPDSAAALWAAEQRASSAPAPPAVPAPAPPAPRPAISPGAPQIHGALAAMVTVSKTSPQK